MLITMGEMLREAQAKSYAVPAPNVWNEESVRAVLDAAEELRSPIILDCSFMVRGFGDRAAQVERAVVHIHAAAIDCAVAADLRAALHRERDIAVAHLVHIHAAAVLGRAVAADRRAVVHRECGAAA